MGSYRVDAVQLRGEPGRQIVTEATYQGNYPDLDAALRAASRVRGGQGYAIYYKEGGGELERILLGDPKKLCADCLYPTDHTAESRYHVKEEIWKEHGAGDEDLCLPCLGRRIGRKLRGRDFPQSEEINRSNSYVRALWERRP